MDPRRAPQCIGNAHLADQPADLQRHNRPATKAFRLPAPIRPETRAMPADNGVRLNDRQSIANSREQPIETNEYQSVDGTEGEFLWSSPPQDVYLLPQRPNLCLERCPRPKQIDDHPTNKSAKTPHPTTGLPDSRSTASQMRFATGTGRQPDSLNDLKTIAAAHRKCRCWVDIVEKVGDERFAVFKQPDLRRRLHLWPSAGIARVSLRQVAQG
jgi:hypothetical protein